MSAITSAPGNFENAAAPAFDAFAARDRGDASPALVRLPVDRSSPFPPPDLSGGTDGGGLAAGLGGGLLGGASGFGVSGLLGGFTSVVSSLVAQLASLTGAQPGTGVPSGSTPATSPQQYFDDATASSLGDPHETFTGSGPSGAGVSQRWDSMTSHADLLDSDSFRGGYRVSTDATAPAANGVTYNREATVTTHGGRTEVSMRADGSYAVSSHGRDVALTQGTPVRLGGGEEVTLNADKSLTVLDDDGKGGTIGTTLRSNGNGVDVSSTAHGVDLGGYLVNRSDAAPATARADAASAYGGWQAGLTYANDPGRAAIGGWDPAALEERPASVAFA